MVLESVNAKCAATSLGPQRRRNQLDYSRCPTPAQCGEPGIGDVELDLSVQTEQPAAVDALHETRRYDEVRDRDGLAARRRRQRGGLQLDPCESA